MGGFCRGKCRLCAHGARTGNPADHVSRRAGCAWRSIPLAQCQRLYLSRCAQPQCAEGRGHHRRHRSGGLRPLHQCGKQHCCPMDRKFRRPRNDLETCGHEFPDFSGGAADQEGLTGPGYSFQSPYASIIPPNRRLADLRADLIRLRMMRNRRRLDTVFPSRRKTCRSGGFLFTFAEVARHHAY
ncbi:hypothetical protein AGR8A_Lc10557 [Agrobacterium fabrum str. J-07]|nr:hypothetical protein AGR8A_Lc10557 [Agrobacterium fabrum str. J-07]